MSMSYVLTQVLPAAIQPAQDTNQDGWWKWVALSLIGALVLSIGSFAFLIVRNWVIES
jgi:hypothetical protein